MPSAKHNSIMANATSLIFSLFGVASVPFGIAQYVRCILHELTSVFYSPLLTVKSVDFVVACDGFLYMCSGNYHAYKTFFLLVFTAESATQHLHNFMQ